MTHLGQSQHRRYSKALLNNQFCSTNLSRTSQFASFFFFFFFHTPHTENAPEFSANEPRFFIRVLGIKHSMPGLYVCDWARGALAAPHAQSQPQPRLRLCPRPCLWPLQVPQRSEHQPAITGTWLGFKPSASSGVGFCSMGLARGSSAFKIAKRLRACGEVAESG